jgi:hypothetical protein
MYNKLRAKIKKPGTNARKNQYHKKKLKPKLVVFTYKNKKPLRRGAL